MRIGMLTSWRLVCGIAEYSSFLVDALRRRGHQVTVLTHYPEIVPPGSEPDPAAVAFFHTLYHPQRGYDADLALHTLDERQIDLVHIQYQSSIYPGPAMEMMARLAQKCPVVATFHDPSTFAPAVLTGAIFHTQKTAEATVAQGLVAGLQRVIPMGIPRFPECPKAEARRRLGIRSEHVLGSFGMTGPDWPKILDLLPGLIARWPDLVYLVLAAQWGSWLAEEVSRRNLQQHVRLIGWLPVAEVILHLQAADLLVQYYTERGVWCSSSASRMAIGSGRPVILSDVNQMWELPAALKVPYGPPEALRDNIIRLLENPDDYKSNLAVCRALVDTDNWDQTALRHETFYREILNRQDG